MTTVEEQFESSMITRLLETSFASKQERAKALGVTDSLSDANVSNVTHWVHCPLCNGKTRTKVYENTVLLWFPLYCPKCHKETIINVAQMKMTPCQEPDAK